jgi:PKD repeat protein
MKKILYSLTWILALQIFLYGCQEDEPQLGSVPTAEDAVFNFTPTVQNANIIEFTNSSDAFLKKWEFGNGTKAEGNTVKGIFPLKGTYEVTLTIFNSGGSITSKRTVEIAKTDPTLLDIPIYNKLTGGNGKPEGKTWVIDAFTPAHFGLGPVAGTAPDWYKAGVNEKAGAGMYDDKYIFKLDAFSYIQQTNGDVFINKQQGGSFPGAVVNAGDLTAPYNAPEGLSWSITEGEKTYLTISNPGFIGYYTGVSTYEVLTLEEDELYLRFVDAAGPEFAWYLRLIPDGVVVPPTPKSTLPLDFEGVKPPFNGFGGSTYDVVANPDATGINTSSKVAQHIKGGESWAGIETLLSAKLDFSTNTLFKYKVYSPVAGDALFKIEESANSNSFIEVHANITKVNEWQELTFDFSAAESNKYDKIALFLDFGVNAGGEFYLDDIKQAAETAELTEAKLTGGSSKTWVLKPAAGSFGVGPGKGSDAYFPNGADISGLRPCLFDDEFIFKTGGVYEYDSKGQIWGEGYLSSVINACTDESNLLANATAWGSGTHGFTFTPATETEPAYITVTGTGAFIALPKAYNGDEYDAGPPAANGSVKYEVLSYVKNGANETLSLTIDIGGGAFWNFVLINK